MLAQVLQGERSVKRAMGEDCLFFSRFQDDGPALLARGEETMNRFKQGMGGGIGECLALTWEQQHQRLNFLDVTWEFHEAEKKHNKGRGAGLLTGVFSKPQRRVAYPRAEPRMTWSAKTGTMTGEIKRHLRLTSTEKRFNRSRWSLRRDFESTGYRPREMERVWQKGQGNVG